MGKDALQVLEHVVIPIAQYAKFISHEPVVAFDVSNGLSVLAAIDLDDQSRFKTEKIRDVWPDRNLPTELERRKPPVLQGKPELALGVRHARAQLAGYPGERPRPPPPPSALAAGSPLPPGGGG